MAPGPYKDSTSSFPYYPNSLVANQYRRWVLVTNQSVTDNLCNHAKLPIFTLQSVQSKCSSQRPSKILGLPFMWAPIIPSTTWRQCLKHSNGDTTLKTRKQRSVHSGRKLVGVNRVLLGVGSIFCLCVYVYCLFAYTVVSSAHDGLPDQQVVPIKSHLCPRAYLFCVLFTHIAPSSVDPAARIVVVASVALLARSCYFLPGVCACIRYVCMYVPPFKCSNNCMIL